MVLTAAQLVLVMPNAAAIAGRFVGPLNQAFARWAIDSTERAAAFLAQAAHETGELRHLEENLNYSADRLCAIWPKRFPSLAEATAYHRNPEKIANRVYGGRLGNGDEKSGDGYLYRGRGIFQLTGRANYRDASIAVAGDADTLLLNPELVAQPEYACETAAWYWDSRACNALADAGDFVAITKKINGGTIGLEDRVMHWKHAIAALS